MKILIVDDDPRLRELVTMTLERAGFATVTAADGQRALIHVAREAPDLVVLDVGLPEMEGFEVCRRIRAQGDVPILFLTARDDEIDRVLGLEMGADDYVTKPFSPRELVARVRAILKRTHGGARAAPLHHGRVSLDRLSHVCRVDGADVALTATEFRLLGLLLAQPARLVGRAQLIAGIWGARSQVSDRTLDSHLRNLRRKLADAGCADAVETVHGVGVRMGPCA
ncbi:response regulator transcription factor [Albidovulum sediminis]|uniref:Response regulator transcription factor n=1 Tax=Albidovulum sediminis TaxID=3066345 RepID=A0ABT2NPZ1_9RHOB|nr:response regulator transcription factor [Defluviimonas sediminis]MCT8330966.1 response regulator transcription factor [Defluviimonas sediminis]